MVLNVLMIIILSTKFNQNRGDLETKSLADENAHYIRLKNYNDCRKKCIASGQTLVSCLSLEKRFISKSTAEITD